MKRTLTALLLALCVLSATGCAKKEQPPEPEEPAVGQSITAQPPAAVPAQPAEPITPLPQTPPAEQGAYVAAGGLEIPIPTEFMGLLLVDTELEAWNEHREPLISLSEKASVEAFAQDYPDEDRGMGWLCSVTRLDRIGFEEWACEEETGTRLFAKDPSDHYYLISRPTDVRFYRVGNGAELPGRDPAALEQWTKLNEWAAALPAEIIARNSLEEYDARELFGLDFTYAGTHVELGCRFPGEPMDLVVLSLSQPVRQGEGGVWCVERVHYVYSDYDWTDTHLVFPAALGFDESAADYYARLQRECDAGQHPELLKPDGAALDYARRAAWLFGEDVSASDLEVIESLG